MPIAIHIPKLPNLLELGPESARGESEAKTKTEQNRNAETKVINTTPNFLVLIFTKIGSPFAEIVTLGISFYLHYRENIEENKYNFVKT